MAFIYDKEVRFPVLKGLMLGWETQDFRTDDPGSGLTKGWTLGLSPGTQVDGDTQFKELLVLLPSQRYQWSDEESAPCRMRCCFLINETFSRACGCNAEDMAVTKRAA